MANVSKEVAIHQFPHFPRPHRPHGDKPIWTAIALVGVASVAVTIGSVVSAGDMLRAKIEPKTEPIPVTPDKKTIDYPRGEVITLTRDSSGEIVIKFDGEPQLLKAIDFNVEEGQNVVFTNNDSENLQEFEVAPDNLINDYFVPFYGDDIFLMRVNVGGQPIGVDGQVLSEEDSPIFTRIHYVNLNIPQAPQKRVLT